MIKVPQLSSGLIIAGAYADKIRRTLFAQLREQMRKGEISSQDIAFAAAQLNRLLYVLFVDTLKMDKGDVVRVRVEYEVINGKIEWKLDTLRVEAFKRIPETEIEEAVKKVIEESKQILAKAIEYSIERVGETEDGDVIFSVKLNEKEVGALIVTPVNEELAIIKKGAVTAPTAVVVEKSKVEVARRPLDEAIKETLTELIKAPKYVDLSEAEHVINIIKKRIEEIGVRKEEERKEEEEEVIKEI